MPVYCLHTFRLSRKTGCLNDGPAWCFDDPSRGIENEPFVEGIDEIISLMTINLPDPGRGFDLLVSEKPFPGHTDRLRHMFSRAGGEVYLWDRSISSSAGFLGWLCPVFNRYFPQPPKYIYVKAEESKKPVGI